MVVDEMAVPLEAATLTSPVMRASTEMMATNHDVIHVSEPRHDHFEPLCRHLCAVAPLPASHHDMEGFPELVCTDIALRPLSFKAVEGGSDPKLKLAG